MRRMELKRNEDTRFDLRPKPADSYQSRAACGRPVWTWDSGADNDHHHHTPGLLTSSSLTSRALTANLITLSATL